VDISNISQRDPKVILTAASILRHAARRAGGIRPDRRPAFEWYSSDTHQIPPLAVSVRHGYRSWYE
jgi:hypothetical protein